MSPTPKAGIAARVHGSAYLTRKAGCTGIVVCVTGLLGLIHPPAGTALYVSRQRRPRHGSLRTVSHEYVRIG